MYFTVWQCPASLRIVNLAKAKLIMSCGMEHVCSSSIAERTDSDYGLLTRYFVYAGRSVLTRCLQVYGCHQNLITASHHAFCQVPASNFAVVCLFFVGLFCVLLVVAMILVTSPWAFSLFSYMQIWLVQLRPLAHQCDIVIPFEPVWNVGNLRYVIAKPISSLSDLRPASSA